MKLRNKKTGEIKELREIMYEAFVEHNEKSLMNLEKEWEDVPEEPEEYYYIDWTPEIGIYHTRDVDSNADKRQKQIGNYFETKEEAEKAVEKLKAWKRLKDKGFKISLKKESNIGYLEANWQALQGDYSDVEICFGGKE